MIPAIMIDDEFFMYDNPTKIKLQSDISQMTDRGE